MREYKNDYVMKRDLLNTGDCILFSGNGPMSTAIKYSTGSPWTHVGMVIRERIVLVWESNLTRVQRQLNDNLVSSGVQICDLGRRIEEYDGEIAVRRLIDPLTQLELDQLDTSRHLVINRPYEQNMIELVKAAYDGPFGENQEDLSSIFCSELLAMYYKEIHRLPVNVPSNEYTPRDFAGKVTNHMLLPLDFIKRSA